MFISSYNISVPNNSRYIISFLCWSGSGMLVVGENQEKHSGNLLLTVPDLPLHTQCTSIWELAHIQGTFHNFGRCLSWYDKTGASAISFIRL